MGKRICIRNPGKIKDIPNKGSPSSAFPIGKKNRNLNKPRLGFSYFQTNPLQCSNGTHDFVLQGLYKTIKGVFQVSFKTLFMHLRVYIYMYVEREREIQKTGVRHPPINMCFFPGGL